jgi:CheY-like chemotaxis protein
VDRVAVRMPNVILLDLKMPVMNGWQFVLEFRARFDDRARIVVMSAADHVSERAREIAAEGWLAKPFRREQLIEAVGAQFLV